MFISGLCSARIDWRQNKSFRRSETDSSYFACSVNTKFMTTQTANQIEAFDL